MQLETLKAVLRQKGYSLTQPRKIIFGLMLNNEPQTMADILRHADNKVDRATIYRTTDLFEKLGIAHRLNIGWKYKLEVSDVFIGHHHQLHCTNSGKISDLPPNPTVETIIRSTAGRQ